ncbi:glycogen debranching enzyme GlgX [Psychromonas sp. psych-6C06]|uniref:glycogen debranching protein GlgX n=1 Tax=Psychromonas sp. psych-6C06 TaxID=2058089 RepID=UPI000C34C952|nr:glycogen debranching protein GlgX [Psychromonas sp. psych-6C06]PKF60604.1 glycogen debranching enzyme GlgX [Psychromonas sp. psych-6C06]
MRDELLTLSTHEHPFSVSSGQFLPLGAHLDEDGKGCHFSVYSLGAFRIELCLFDKCENEVSRYALDVKLGHMWSIFVHNVKAGQLYGYRVYGENDPANGMMFDPDNLLIDPYAKALNRVQHSFETLENKADGLHISKSMVIDGTFDWEGTKKPVILDDERILYEVHVKGFSQLNEAIPLAKRGKYLGLSAPASIAHYKKLGITSLQIMPVFSFMSEPRLKALGLTNYWGYNPINFFSPECRYAQYDAVNEFKTMVKELHQAGIEVILDVVYNHTAESGIDGAILSFKGFDNRHYYTFEKHANSGAPDYLNHSNHSGCGNTVNLNNPWTLKLVLDSLRYWVTEMQVDGFRFDLAVTLAREENGFNEQSAFFKSLLQDPVLSKVKLIAEPWDIGPGGYRLGGFPSDWLECNDRFRDTLRSFWRGDTGHVADVATRLLGSRDMFAKHYRSNSTSVNYICYHDGFTLDDLVSYADRHNLANEENNRDGHGNNLSANYGAEGDTDNPRINALREQQKRNLITTLLLSQGTPHFLAGDEMGNHQSGNNNAYCQDNKITWLSWKLAKVDQQLFDFTSATIKLRRESRLFGKLVLSDDCLNGCENSDLVKWYHPDGYLMEAVDWHAHNSQAIAVELREASTTGEHWFVILNASSYQIGCKLPELKKGLIWKVKVDTACESGQLVDEQLNCRESVHLKGHSLMLLKCIRHLR